MQLRFSHKILLAGCSIVILVFSLFALYNDYLQRKSIRSNLEFSMDQAGVLTAGSVQNWLDGRLLLLQNLASNLANRSAPSDQLELIDQPAFTSNFLFTYLGGADGSFIQTPDEDDLPDDYDPRTRPWYTGSAQARGTFLTEPYQDTTGVLVITMSAPVTRYGQLAGVVGGDLSLATLVEIINSVDFGGLGHAFLVSGDGQVLVSPEQNQVMRNLNEIYSGTQPRLEQRLQAVQLNGQQRLLSFTPISDLPSTDWYVGLSMAVSSMQQSQASSSESVQVANQAGERLATVVSRIVEIDGMNQSVAAATEEQTTVVEALNMDIHQINVLNQQGVANLNETLQDCDALSHQASRLKQLVDSFRI